MKINKFGFLTWSFYTIFLLGIGFTSIQNVVAKNLLSNGSFAENLVDWETSDYATWVEEGYKEKVALGSLEWVGEGGAAQLIPISLEESEVGTSRGLSQGFTWGGEEFLATLSFAWKIGQPGEGVLQVLAVSREDGDSQILWEQPTSDNTAKDQWLKVENLVISNSLQRAGQYGLEWRLVSDDDNANVVIDEIAILSMEKDTTPPEPPTVIKAQDTRRGGSVILNWTLTDEVDLAGYNIYRVNGEEEQIANPDLVQGATFTDTGLENGKEYTYYLKAVDMSNNESEASEKVIVTPTLDETPPPIPKNLQVEDLGVGRKILVEWPAVSAEDLLGYNLYRKEKETWIKLNTEPLTETTFYDENVVNGTVYRYRISSEDHIGNESSFPEPVMGWGTNKNAQVIWQFGKEDQEGNGDGEVYAPYGVDIAEAGTLLVADSHNGRVLEVDTEGNILWKYRGNLIEPSRVKAVNESEVLIVDSEGSSVRIVNKNTNEINWIYGKEKRRHGKGAGQLNNPSDAELLPSGNILIADTGNGRIIEVDPKGKVVWSTENKDFKTTIDLPVSIEAVESNILITDVGTHRVIEVDRKGNIIWSHGTGIPGKGKLELDYPTQSIRLPNENTLIVDSMNYRLVEVSKEGYVVWQFGDRAQPGKLFEPGGITWSPQTNYIFVADQHNHRIVEIDH